MRCFIELLNLVKRFGHRSCRKDNQLAFFFSHGCKADRLKNRGCFRSGQIVQECLGRIRVLADIQHRGGIDDLTAHFRRCSVYTVKAGREGIGGVHHAAVHTGFRNLGGDFLHVGAVGEAACLCQLFLIQAIEVEYLLCILAYRHIAVAHGHEDIARLQQLGQLVKALDALGVAFGNREDNLVFQEVDAAALQHKVQSVRVLLGIAGGIQCVHLLRCGRDEDIAVRTLLDLGLQGTGGVEVVNQGNAGILRLIEFLDLIHRLRHGGRRKNDQFRLVCGEGAWCCQCNQQGQHQQQGDSFFHARYSFSHVSGSVLYKRVFHRLYRLDCPACCLYSGDSEVLKNIVIRLFRIRSSGSDRPCS